MFSVQFSLSCTQTEISVSEDAGIVENLLFIEKTGETNGNLTIKLLIDTVHSAVQGREKLHYFDRISDEIPTYSVIC